MTTPSDNSDSSTNSGDNGSNIQTSASTISTMATTNPQATVVTSSLQSPTLSSSQLAVSSSSMTTPPTTVTTSTERTTTELPPSSSTSNSSRSSTSFECTTCRCCRQCCRTLRTPSEDRFCFIVPANLWMKIRLCAVFSLLIGMFLLIIFPNPESPLFTAAVILLVIAGSFVVIDILRGIISNYWYRNFGRTDTSIEMSGRARTIEVTGNTGFDDYDNPAFSADDSPPDYDTAIATPAAPIPATGQTTSSDTQRLHRPPDITIDISTIQGTSRDNANTPDVLPNPYYPPSSMSPTSIFSFEGPRSPPPSYEDVIKETDVSRSGDLQQRDEGDQDDDPTEDPGPS